MGIARFSTLLLALVIASPALYTAFVAHQLPAQTALLRLLIAVPVAAIMLGLVRTVTKGYGEQKGRSVRADAVAGEPVAPAPAGPASSPGQRRTTDVPPAAIES